MNPQPTVIDAVAEPESEHQVLRLFMAPPGFEANPWSHEIGEYPLGGC